MPTTGGPLKWPTNGGDTMLQAGMWLDGQFYHGGAFPRFGASTNVGGTVFQMLGKNHIYQFVGLGGDQPVNMHPGQWDLDILIAHQEDYDLLNEVSSKGEPVELFFDLYGIDLWLISAANSGQTIWKTSRKLPYSVTGISTATRPPQAFIDDTEQTIIYSGSPASGEVKVPSVGGYGDIEAPSGITGTYLKLRYPMVHMAKLANVSWSYRDANQLRCRATAVEALQNTYTAAEA